MKDQPKNLTLRFKVGNLMVTKTRYVDYLLRHLPNGDIITRLEPRISKFSFVPDAVSLFDLKYFDHECFNTKVNALQRITSVESLAALLDTIPENVNALFAGHRYPFMMYGLFYNLLMYENSYLNLIDVDRCKLVDDIGQIVLYGSMTLQQAAQELTKQSSKYTAARVLDINGQMLYDLISCQKHRAIELSRYEAIAMRLYMFYGIHVSILPEQVRPDELI